MNKNISIDIVVNWILRRYSQYFILGTWTLSNTNYAVSLQISPVLSTLTFYLSPIRWNWYILPDAYSVGIEYTTLCFPLSYNLGLFKAKVNRYLLDKRVLPSGTSYIITSDYGHAIVYFIFQKLEVCKHAI